MELFHGSMGSCGESESKIVVITSSMLSSEFKWRDGGWKTWFLVEESEREESGTRVVCKSVRVECAF